MGHDEVSSVFLTVLISFYHMHRKSAIVSAQVCCVMQNVCSSTYKFEIGIPVDQIKLLGDNLRCPSQMSLEEDGTRKCSLMLIGGGI